MSKSISCLAFVILLVSCSGEKPEKDQETSISKDQVSLVDYVNPLMGTDSKMMLSNGNTYPVIATPWGMNFWTPMTSKMGDGWTYKYNENKIRGIKQTHQPSPWINDYAAFSLMAVTGDLKFEEEERDKTSQKEDFSKKEAVWKKEKRALIREVQNLRSDLEQHLKRHCNITSFTIF